VNLKEYAEVYRNAGLGITRLIPGEKNPVHIGWTLCSLEPDAIHDGHNTGILLGRISNDLVCVDLDTADSVQLADKHPSVSLGSRQNPYVVTSKQ
jgi:hypothetical protein